MNTRDKIVYLADEFIRTQGYNAFSYSDIGKYMAMRPAAVHYHFPIKTDLGLEVIRRELARVAQFRRQAPDGSGGDQLKRLFQTFWRQAVEGRLCLMGSLTSDFTTFDDPMQDAVRNLCGEIASWVADCLEEERKEGRMRFEGNAADRALLIVSTLLSSLLMGRVLGMEVFVPMADQLLKDLGADWRIWDLEAPPEDFDNPYSYV